MYFLNYTETNLRFVYFSTIRLLILRQKSNFNNSYIIKMPVIKYYFIFNKIVEVNLLKIYNNLLILWLILGKKGYIKKFFNRLERGIRFYRFILNVNVNTKNFFKLFDFLSNVFFFLGKNYIKIFKDVDYLILKISNLEYFSNLRLSNYFYTSKVNDNLYIYYFLKGNKYIRRVDDILKYFKMI
jgi:hypothetical protein